MESQKVVVKGGSDTLFKVSSHSGTYYVYKIEGFFGTHEKKIGETKSLESALALIKAYSGRDIDKIGPW